MQFYAKHVTECFPLHAIAFPPQQHDAVFTFFNKKTSLQHRAGRRTATVVALKGFYELAI